MLNTLCILTNRLERIQQATKTNKNTLFILSVNYNLAEIKGLFASLFTGGKTFPEETRVSICLNFPQTFSSDDAGEIYAFLCNIIFHPSYYVQQNAPAIFYINNFLKERTNVAELEQIKESLLDQKFSSVQLIPLITTAENDVNQIVSLVQKESMDSVANFYVEYFLRQGIYNKYFVVADNDAWNTADVEKKLSEAEDLFAASNTLLHNQLKTLLQLSKENEEMKWKDKAYLAEIENYKTYLDLLITQDEAGYINNFYYHEYEILPLWYKRFGHIIKVLTGKRTFKSLFDKNKKYKS